MGVKEIQVKATAILAAVLTLPAIARHYGEAKLTSNDLLHFSPDSAARLSAVSLKGNESAIAGFELARIRSGYLFVMPGFETVQQTNSVTFSVIDPKDIPMPSLTVTFSGTSNEVERLRLQCEHIRSGGHPWALAKLTGRLSLQEGNPMYIAQTIELSAPEYEHGTSMVFFKTKLPKANFEGKK